MIADLLFFPEAVARLVWLLLVGMMIVAACVALWVVGGFVVGLVEDACMAKSDPDKRGRRR